MAANQLVQTRIDGAIKEEAAAVLAAMGLTVSDAVRMMLTKVAHEHALPFDPLIPNATTIAAMMEARAGNLSSVSSITDLKAALNAVSAKLTTEDLIPLLVRVYSNEPADTVAIAVVKSTTVIVETPEGPS